MQRNLWIVVAAAGLYAAVTIVMDGSWALGIALGAAALVYSWWISPFKGGRTTRHREVVAMPEQDRPVVIYWRPGCGFCARLRSTLGDRADDAQWINIWQDKEAAAFVRSVNDGNEVVPTVVLDGIPVTNPNPKVVLDKLAA